MISAEFWQAAQRLDRAAKMPLLDSEGSSSVTSAIDRFVDVGRKLQGPVHAILNTSEVYPGKLKMLDGRYEIEAFAAIGNLDLLGLDAVGICGSRKASDKGLHVASEVCGELARAGVVIVSGYASGVDEQAHDAALSSGGCTICVMPEGINHFRVKRTLRRNWDWSRVLVISQFGLDQIWQAGRAMQRNKTIVALSDVVLVVEARESGGTLDAGFSALRMKKPLLVVDYADSGEATAGNEVLIRNGGVPFRKRRSTGFAAVNKISDLLHAAH